MLTNLLLGDLGLVLFGLAVVVGYRLLTGAINTDGMFDQVDPTTGERTFSPERVQLLLATLFAAGYYVVQVFNDPNHLPDVPNWLLLTQGGSGTIYLGGKGLRLYQALTA